MNHASDVAIRLRNAADTAQVLARLCRNHPDLRPTLRKARRNVQDALLELQDALRPSVPLPAFALILPPATRRTPQEDAEQGILSKALLLEIVLRAAHDWVLYKGHARTMYREWANDAFTWIFEEGPAHPRWKERRASGKLLTSFIAICEVLDYDPDVIRRYIRTLTPQRIMSMGRPSEYRRRLVQTEEYADSADVRAFFSSENCLV